MGSLIELAGSGLEREEYPYTQVLRLLRAHCDAESPLPLDCSTKDIHQARHWCVWWYAKYGTAADIAEMFRLAFASPLDATALIKASSYVFADRRQTPLTVDQSTDLLLDMGRHLKASSLGTAPRKDIARAWKAAMRSFVPASGTAIQLRIVQALPDLDDAFAGQLVQCLPLNRRSEVRTALQRVAVSPGLGSHLKRNVNKILDLHRRHFSDGGWPVIFEDLKTLRK